MLASVHQVIKEICIKHVNMKCQSTGDSFFLTINLDKRCVIDTQPRAGKSYFEEKKIELDYV